MPVAAPVVVLVEPDFGSALEVAVVCAFLGSALEVVELAGAFLGSTLLVAVPAGTDFWSTLEDVPCCVPVVDFEGSLVVEPWVVVLVGSVLVDDCCGSLFVD